MRCRTAQWRLSRNLQREDLEGAVGGNLLGMAANHVGQHTLLVVSMPRRWSSWPPVRDGSEQELGPGYWTLHVIGAQYVEQAAKRLFGVPDFK